MLIFGQRLPFAPMDEQATYKRYIMTPMLQMSHCWLYSWALITSGAAK